MSNIKERIMGAVTIMSDQEAEKVWNMIQDVYKLYNAEEVSPEPDEISGEYPKVCVNLQTDVR